MGKEINSVSGLEFSPYVSPDGEYLFFMSTDRESKVVDGELNFDILMELHDHPGFENPCIFWISTDFIDNLRSGI